MGVPSIEISKKRERKERNLPLETWSVRSVSLFWGCERVGRFFRNVKRLNLNFYLIIIIVITPRSIFIKFSSSYDANVYNYNSVLSVLDGTCIVIL